jgi:hypothetical protein
VAAKPEVGEASCPPCPLCPYGRETAQLSITLPPWRFGALIADVSLTEGRSSSAATARIAAAAISRTRGKSPSTRSFLVRIQVQGCLPGSLSRDLRSASSSSACSAIPTRCHLGHLGADSNGLSKAANSPPVSTSANPERDGPAFPVGISLVRTLLVGPALGTVRSDGAARGRAILGRGPRTSESHSRTTRRPARREFATARRRPKWRIQHHVASWWRHTR